MSKFFRIKHCMHKNSNFHKTVSTTLTEKAWRDMQLNEVHRRYSWKVLWMWDYVKYVDWNSLIIMPNLDQARAPRPTDPDKCTDRYIRINGPSRLQIQSSWYGNKKTNQPTHLKVVCMYVHYTWYFKPDFTQPERKPSV